MVRASARMSPGIKYVLLVSLYCLRKLAGKIFLLFCPVTGHHEKIAAEEAKDHTVRNLVAADLQR